MTIEEAIDVLDRNYPDKCFGILCDAVDMAIKALEGQKIGNWIEYGINKDGTHSICCDQCGGKIKSKGHAHSVYTANTYEYCPHCGSHMEVEDE